MQQWILICCVGQVFTVRNHMAAPAPGRFMEAPPFVLTKTPELCVKLRP